jgi:hypothetical protein
MMKIGTWMMGFVAWAPLAAASILALGCASASAATHAPSVSDAREPPSVAVEYEVTRKGAPPDQSVILQGRTRIDARNDAEIKHAARDHEELRLGARERSDGTFDVEVRYREASQEGEIAWQPVLRLARGSSATADVAGAGWARSIRVKLE